jgi:hypothetical protein
MKKGLKLIRTPRREANHVGVGSIALMKKGLKRQMAGPAQRAASRRWKYCPDEEGIETQDTVFS